MGNKIRKHKMGNMIIRKHKMGKFEIKSEHIKWENVKQNQET